MLEGNELEKKYDGGELIVDVDAQGGLKLSASYEKDFDGVTKAKSVNSLETNIFVIAEKIAKQSAATWDDTAIATLKKILGIA